MSAALFPPASARDTVRTWALAPGWVACALLAAVFAFDPAVPLELQYLPLVVSVVLVGLPHGAIDHLVPARLRGESPDARSMLGVGLLYALLGGAYTAAWFLVPVACFAFFILLTLAHWGQGDVHAVVALGGGDHLRSRPQRVLAAVVRGGFPMLVPLVAFPEQYRAVAGALVAPFAAAPDPLAPAFAPDVRLVVGVGFALLVAVHLALGYRSGGAGWRLDAGETVLLGAFFATVPPVLAVGTYFCLWHAARHVARLALLDEPSVRGLRRGRVRPALVRFAKQAAPLTALSLAFLGGLYLVVPDRPTTVPGFVGLYLVLIAALTLPHVAVVAWMDRAQGLWRAAVSERA
ncbi:Brp/Blh family beta-carotene 15,15'-dioxygenase [Halosegnis marinus]|uniref:Probable beta-carotene 15,15'-dioxygenase n=1 Tax=Halosegnis marinus TaxID=3034023 RepID=A0ABD5ZNL9_9EURY|nr:Brp/Blh family beta-carotene 15,15'-dioxygenase [Halosegnis sp. DT85]